MQRSTITIPVDTDRFLSLYEFLKGQGSDADPVEVVGKAIDYWMDNADWKAELLPERRTGKGYRWKELFLPDGSEVRMKYQGTYYYAEVRVDEFRADDQRSSPSQFAHSVTQSSRNAWRDLEIKRPHDRTWIAASSLRAMK